MENLSAVIGLFQMALDAIGYIQLAREFKDQFEIYQLKLDILQLRLSRWGEIAKVASNVRSTDSKASTPDRPENYQDAHEQPSEVQASLSPEETILGNITDRLEKAKRDAQKLQKQMGDSSGLDPELYIPKDIKKVRSRFAGFLRRRRGQVLQKLESAKWVFYKKDVFAQFVKDMSELLDQLEQTLSDADRQKLSTLSQEECKGISKSSLEELNDIVEECDPWLKNSIEQALDDSSSGTVVRQSYNTGSTVGVHNGDNKGITHGANAHQTNTFN